MTPEDQLIAINNAMAAALARHGCHPSGSAIRSAWFAGIAASGPDQSRKIAEMESETQLLRLRIQEMHDERARLRAALIRLRDCDWVITPADRMDAVRDIAREALKRTTEVTN